MYEFRHVRGHIEVYDPAGQFLFSADTLYEVHQELEDSDLPVPSYSPSGIGGKSI